MQANMVLYYVLSIHIDMAYIMYTYQVLRMHMGMLFAAELKLDLDDMFDLIS